MFVTNIHTQELRQNRFILFRRFVKNTFLFQSEQKESMHLVIKLSYILKICSKRNTQALNNYEHVAFALKRNFFFSKNNLRTILG